MKILKIEKIEQYRATYDIETEETHTYQLHNKCVVHNSTSAILGTSSGIHPGHARRYIRRVQANKQEFPVQYFEKINPLAIEQSKWKVEDKVISFLCEVPKGGRVKNDVPALQLLKSVKTTQQNWINSGGNPDLCVNKKVIYHSVSNTITVNEDEWDEVGNFIYTNRDYFVGISLLPASGDLDYVQAPFATVYNAKELVEMYGDGAVLASGLIVDGLKIYNDDLWAACNYVLHYKDINDDIPPGAKEWLRRCLQFANRYFDGDVRKMTYCLKHVKLHKFWLDLKRTYKDIDWSEVYEEDPSYVEASSLAGAACSGGQCEIQW